jgi:hypothetical protein
MELYDKVDADSTPSLDEEAMKDYNPIDQSEVI